MSAQRGGPFRIAGIASLLLALGVGGAAADTGRVLMVDVNEPFVIEGRTFDPGLLSFRRAPGLNPSVGREEIRVDGVCLGLLPVHRLRAEGAHGRDAALFFRDTRGRLVLAGFSRRSGPDAGTVRLAGVADPEPVVLIAAR